MALTAIYCIHLEIVLKSYPSPLSVVKKKIKGAKRRMPGWVSIPSFFPSKSAAKRLKTAHGAATA